MTTLLIPTTPQTTRRRERLVARIERALERFLPPAQRAPQIVHEAMRYAVFSGGKRFRPLLCLGAVEAVGGTIARALPVACALELIHTYSLVHDDLPAMDNADERRGQPSCHRKFGEGHAILIGDALLTLAFDLLSRHNIPATLAIIQTVSKACGTTGLIGGQVLDLDAQRLPQMPTESVLRDIAQRKTAALMTASVVAGALAGGGSGLHVQRLARYGQDVGIAFQLMDDAHDGEGLARAMGIERARAEAQRLTTHAMKSLTAFGPRARLLRELAQWLAAS